MKLAKMMSSTIKTASGAPSLHSHASSPLPLQTRSRNLIPIERASFQGNSALSTTKRNLSVVSAYTTDNGLKGDSFFRSVLGSMETVYLNRNSTAKSVLELVQSAGDEQICYDHLAFRTFGVNGYGIDSLARFFLDYGYTQKEELKFPAKKLKALWFSPPNIPHPEGGNGVNGPLPRIFISELLVDQMSPQTQEIIRKYTETSGSGNKYAALASALGSLTWEKPLHSEFQQLARESEYAAWTLVNGYAVNHVTISTHRLKSHLKNIKSLNEFIEQNGFKLNSEGGILKVSPDSLLLQSSTVADSIPFCFSDGVTEPVSCSYIEFAERLVLPQYKNLPEGESFTGGMDLKLGMLTRSSRAHPQNSLVGDLLESENQLCTL